MHLQKKSKSVTFVALTLYLCYYDINEKKRVNTMLIGIIVALIIYIAVYAVVFIPSVKMKIGKIDTYLYILLCFANTALLTVAQAYIKLCLDNSFTAFNTAFSLFYFLLSAACALLLSGENCNNKRFIKSVAVIFPLIIVLEVGVFNVSAFKNRVTTELLNAEICSNVDAQNNIYCISSNGTLTYDCSITDVEYIRINIDAKATNSGYVTVLYTDKASVNYFQTAYSKRFYKTTQELQIPISPYNELTGLKLEFRDMQSDITVSGVSAVVGKSLDLSYIRMVILFLILLSILCIKHFKLYSIVYQPQKVTHFISILAVFILCTVIPISVLSMSWKDAVEYNPDDVQYASIYIKQYDALNKGRLDLDISADERLDTLVNPYDWNLRYSENVSSNWDHSYYNGKYYCYFGIVPVFTVYAPYYLATGMMPCDAAVTSILTLEILLFLFLAAVKLTKLFIPRCNLLGLLSGLVMLGLGSGIMALCVFSAMYTIAILSALANMFAVIFFSLCAYDAKRPALKYVYLALSGIFAVLCAGSRPTTALMLLCVVPLYIAILRDKALKIKTKLISIISFAVPLAAGAATLMWFNYARFGSAFEFGSTYQITVSDVSANEISLSRLPSALYHIFLQELNVDGNFPYLTYSVRSLNNYGQYVYCDASGGMINFPAIFLGVFGCSYMLIKSRENSVRNWFFATALVTSVSVAFAVHCMGGVVFRYIVDILPLCAVAAFYFLNRWLTYKKHSAFSVVTVMLLFIGTALLSLMPTVNYYGFGTALTNYFPWLIDSLESIFTF